MAAPKFLTKIKTRLLATTATTASTIAAGGYLASLPPEQLSQNLTSVVGAFATSLLIASGPQFLSTILNVGAGLITGDLYERLTSKQIYKQIPKEATLYESSYIAFQSILNDVVTTEEKRADKRLVKNLRDISLDDWLNLVSLDEQEDNISEVAAAVLTKFTDEKTVEHQFLNAKDKIPASLVTRQDWLVVLLRLQGKEDTYLPTELETKVLDSLTANFTTRLRSTLSKHEDSFRKVTLQLLSEISLDVKAVSLKVDDVTKDTKRIIGTQDVIAADIKKLLGGHLEIGIPEVTDDNQSALPEKVKERIKEAKRASKLGKFELSRGIWKEIVETALETDNQELSIRIRLEIALIEVQDDLGNLGNALKIAEECLVESKKIKLGSQVGRILQLLGEFHRLNRDTEKAKGFMKASLEFSKLSKNKKSEAWTLLSMAMLSWQNKESIDTQLEYTRQAYDVFTSLQASGEKESIEQANDGHATCHLQRAESYGYSRFDEALPEYSRAIAIYRQMGESREFQLGRVLLARGEMQANVDLEQGVQDIFMSGEIFQKLGNHYMEAKCVMAIGELLDKRGDREASEAYFRLALQKVFLISDERKKGWFILRYAMKLLELGEYDIAKEALLMLLSNEETTESQKLDVLRILSDLAKATKNAKELTEYEEYSISIIEVLIGEATSPNERLHLLYKKGHTLEGLERYELALETFQRAIRLAESMSSKVRLVDCWNSIARVYAEMENTKEERSAYEQVLKIVGDDESSPQLGGTLMMLAQMEMKESNFEKAKELLDRAEKLCEKVMPFLMFAIHDIRQRLKEAEAKK